MTRRGFLLAGAFGAGASVGGAAVSLIGHGPGSEAVRRPAPSLKVGDPRRVTDLALSLREYQRELAAAFERGRELPESVRQMHGLNRIDGILMEQGNDVVLAGGHEPQLPAMEVDDLVVSLRNAYGVEGYEGSPGCTIDPMADAVDPWSVQDVKAFGMPPTAPMSVRHVAIDYNLKRVSAGLFLIHPAIPNMFDSQSAPGGPCSGTAARESAKTHMATHRFWFTPLYPDRPRFVQDENATWIEKPVLVQLQCEEEFLRNGSRVGGAPPQPEAVRFTRAVTEQLAGNEVADYTHLRNDFRLIEVARVMRFRETDAAAIRYLLEDCPLRQLPALSRVSGIRRLTTEEVTCAGPASRGPDGVEGISHVQYVQHSRREFRGGVEGRVKVATHDFADEGLGPLGQIRRNIRESRSRGAVAWQVRGTGIQ